MPTQSLKGQRVLVTRPAHQATSLCTALTDAGAEAVPFPTLEIEAIDQQPENHQHLKNCFMHLDLYQSVIFVSANAAKLAHQWIDQYWPQLPVGVNWLAVGSATAKTLTQLGIPVTHPETGMDSEQLLTEPCLQNIENSKILICRGQGGREHLREQLGQRGAEVDYAELYRRGIPDYDDHIINTTIYNQLPTLVLVTSLEGLENLDTLGQGTSGQFPIQRLRAVKLIVPSARVAENARRLGYTQIQIAENATDEAMLAAIQKAL